MNELYNKLLSLNVSEEEAKGLIENAKKEYIKVEDYNSLKAENELYKTNEKELNKTIKELEKENNLSEGLKLQLEDYKNKISEKDKQLEKIKYNSKLEIELNKANTKSIKALKALLNLDEVKLSEDGELKGLAEQIEALKESDGYLFNEDNKTQNLGGTTTTKRQKNIKNPFSKEHFNITEQIKLMKENPQLARQLQDLQK